MCRKRMCIMELRHGGTARRVRAFGHNGSSTCLAWADPERQVVMAYLTNLLPPGSQRARHVSQVSDAVLSARYCPPAG